MAVAAGAALRRRRRTRVGHRVAPLSAIAFAVTMAAMRFVLSAAEARYDSLVARRPAGATNFSKEVEP
ncbi:MAG: hypothetical protein HT579_12525 [Candidatus Accumulibacter similis]|nr:MAG: hypothetical protein HT579_12525 [Candidatus Accumulibacter similis]